MNDENLINHMKAIKEHWNKLEDDKSDFELRCPRNSRREETAKFIAEELGEMDRKKIVLDQAPGIFIDTEKGRIFLRFSTSGNVYQTRKLSFYPQNEIEGMPDF